MKRLLDKLLIYNLILLIVIVLLLFGSIVFILKPELLGSEGYMKYITYAIAAILLIMLLRQLTRRRKLKAGCDRLNHEGDLTLTGEEPPKRAEFRSGKIYCGKEAMYSDRDGVLMFYDEILWIYKSLNKLKGISAGESKFFCIRDGRSYRMHMSEEDMNSLINKYIYPAQPKLILGYTPLNQSEYERRKSDRKGRK